MLLDLQQCNLLLTHLWAGRYSVGGELMLVGKLKRCLVVGKLADVTWEWICDSLRLSQWIKSLSTLELWVFPHSMLQKRCDGAGVDMMVLVEVRVGWQLSRCAQGMKCHLLSLSLISSLTFYAGRIWGLSVDGVWNCWFYKDVFASCQLESTVWNLV